jgi:hypothetical protein
MKVRRPYSWGRGPTSDFLQMRDRLGNPYYYQINKKYTHVDTAFLPLFFKLTSNICKMTDNKSYINMITKEILIKKVNI